MGRSQQIKEEFVAVSASDDVKEGQLVASVVNNQPVVIIRSNQNLYAVSGVCSHAYSELADGELEGERLYCSLHFACFDIRTGVPLEGPTDRPLRTFEVKESDGIIWVRG